MKVCGMKLLKLMSIFLVVFLTACGLDDLDQADNSEDASSEPVIGYTQEYDEGTASNVITVYNPFETQVLQADEFDFRGVAFQSKDYLLIQFYDIVDDHLMYKYVSRNAMYDVKQSDIDVLQVRESTIGVVNGGLVFVAIPAPLTDNIFNVYQVNDSGVSIIYADVNHYAGAGAGGDYYFYPDDTVDGTVKKYDGASLSDYKVFSGEEVKRLEARDDALYVTYTISASMDDDADHYLLIDDFSSESTSIAATNSYPLIKNDDITLVYDSSWDNAVHSVSGGVLTGLEVDHDGTFRQIMQAETLGNSNTYFVASTSRHGSQSIYRWNGTSVEVELNEVSPDGGVSFYDVNTPADSSVVIDGVTYFVLYDDDDNYYAYKIENEIMTQVNYLAYDIEYIMINDNGSPAVYREEDDGSIGLYDLDLNFIRFLSKP